MSNIMFDLSLIAYSWLNQNLLSPLISFAKGFELAIILFAAVIFILITTLVVLRQAKKLPESYKIRITDIFGQGSSIDELRVSFSTYDAAESYAREYRKTYGNSYRFRVTGIREPVQISDPINIS